MILEEQAIDGEGQSPRLAAHKQKGLLAT